jgi:hypothetical protein
MKVLFKEINLVQEILKLQEITHKPTMLSKQLKKKKNFKDMVMNSMENLENVKKKLKL